MRGKTLIFRFSRAGPGINVENANITEFLHVITLRTIKRSNTQYSVCHTPYCTVKRGDEGQRGE